MENELRIRTLTERFFEGETTLAEEHELYEYYRSGEVPADLQPLQSMFLGLEAVELKQEEPEQKEVPLQLNATNAVTTRRKPIIWKWITAAAAVVVLLISGASLFWSQQNECVAYIYGEKCTDQDVIMQELERNIGAMTEGQNDIESQLNEMFNIN